MAGGFFRTLYFGNENKADLTKEQVYGNRFKLFFDVLGVRFTKLIQLNLLYLLFCIPLITIGPATAAMVWIVSTWAKDEHAWLWSDFWQHFKSNFKQGIEVFAIDVLAVFIIWVNIRFYNIMGQTNSIYYMMKFFVLGVALLFSMMHIYIFPLMVTYELKLKDIFRNAFIFTAVKLPHTIGILALCAAIVMISFYLYIIPIFIITFSLCWFIIASYTNWIFDKYINCHLDDKGHYVPIKQQDEAEKGRADDMMKQPIETLRHSDANA